MQIRHLIMTRFNIECDKSIIFKGNDPSYLAQRFALFEQFCLPSIAAQTRKDFTWLVLFHPQTPEPYLSRIQKFAKEYSFFEPVFTNVEKDINLLVSELAEQHREGSEWLLTTRLDNDDMLHRDYVKSLREEIDKDFPKQKTFYTFPNGFQILLPEKAIFHSTFIANHFLSLLESSTPPQTALGLNHLYVEGEGSLVKRIKDLDGWVEIVHTSNWANTFDPHYHPKAWFTLEEKAFPISLSEYYHPLENTGLALRKYIILRANQVISLFRKIRRNNS